MNCSNYCFICPCCKEIDIIDYDVKCYCCKQFSTTITVPNPKYLDYQHYYSDFNQVYWSDHFKMLLKCKKV